jgi:hypothetical protein
MRLLFLFILISFGASAQKNLFHAHNKSAGTPPPPAFVPTDSAGCILWLKADGIGGLSDGDPISTWEDFSTSNNDATQSGSNRPTYQTNEIDGKPVVRFDGSDDYFDLTSSITSINSTVFFVYKKNGTFGTQFVTLTSSATANEYTWLDFSDGNAYIVPGSPNANYWFAPGNKSSYTLISQTADATSTLVWINGVSESLSTGGIGTSSFGFDELGRRQTGGNYANGDLVEVIYYDHVLTTTGRTTVENYLMTKYPSL